MDRYLLDFKTEEEQFSEEEDAWGLEEEESEEKIRYHFVPGNEKIVFIKAGAGGSERGYEDKYVKMAELIHERNGATVITASNPLDPICGASDAEEIRRVAREMGFEKFELYLVGVSDGAYLNLELASRFPETVKWMGINSSFISISVRDMEKKLAALPSVGKLLVYGTLDEGYDVGVMLKTSKIEALEFVSIEGADHRFTDMTATFVELVDFL